MAAKLEKKCSFAITAKSTKTKIMNKTKKKRTETGKILLSLEADAQRHSVLFIQNPDPVALCDSGFKILEVNPSFKKIFGYNLKDVKGKDINKLMVPDDSKDKVLSAKHVFNKDSLVLWTTCLAKDGSEVYGSMSVAPLVAEKNVYGYLFMYKDVTELVFANKELSSIFTEVDRMLNEANLLNEKLGVMGNLTRHDVRNKLAGITNYLYLARKRNCSDQDFDNYLYHIQEIVKRTVQILDFAKTFEMLGTQELTMINVGKMVNDASALFTDLKGVTLINECENIQVYADSLVMELFHNLMDNSFKYGEKLTTIRVSVSDVIGGRELVYEDDGVGIDPELKTMLFQKGIGKGTGYGLWLIKRICQMYGWEITEKGIPGEGVRFVIFVPQNSSKIRSA